MGPDETRGGQALAQEVARLAYTFLSREDVSMRDLVAAVGIGSQSDDVMRAELRNEFRRHPEYIQAWLQYSEDKRVDEGWYLSEKPGGIWVVGCQRASLGGSFERDSNDASLACSEFVVGELSDMV
jgi:hypothetical protein